MKLLRRNRKNLDEDLKNIEAQLVEFLHPVPPRPEFLSGLQAMILLREIPTNTNLFPKRISNRLLVAGGIIGSLLMLIASIRGLISLIGVFSLVLKLSQRNSQEQQATPALS